MSLVDGILELHSSSDPGRSREAPRPWRPDYLLLGPDAARFVLPLGDAWLSGARAALVTLGSSPRPLAPPAAGDDEGRGLADSARRLGVPLLTMGVALEHVFREAAAAPGRLLALCGLEDSALGALGCLAWRVRPLEAVALLCGRAIVSRPERLARIVLHGELAPGVRGTDAALELARRVDPAEWRGCGLECVGPGATAMDVPDRMAFAHVLTSAGAAHVLFPSDDRTRDALRAWERDADWRELRAADEPGDERLTIELDLDGLEPLVAPWDDVTLARPLREVAGRTLRGVVVGPHADEPDVTGFEQRLPMGAAAPGLTVAVLGATGLRSAQPSGAGTSPPTAGPPGTEGPGGVDDAATWRPSRREAGTWLGVGLGPTQRAELGERAWIANVEACAASALLGVISDPRERLEEWQAPQRSRGRRSLPPVPQAPPEANGTAESASVRGVAPASPSLRAVVWIEADDDCAADQVLPRGARGRTSPDGDLLGRMFPGTLRGRVDDPGRAGPGAVVAGRRFCGGPSADEAAWCLARAGVRVVLAASLAPDAARALAHAGVLPLESPEGPEERVALCGEEIEIPSLAAGVEPEHPVGVRNLTRGVQGALQHTLDADLVAIWRAGGILADVPAEGGA